MTHILILIFKSPPKTTKPPRREPSVTSKVPSAAGGGPKGPKPGGQQLKFVTMKPAIRNKFVEDEIQNIGLDLNTQNKNDPWQTGKDWVRSRSIYPQKHQALGSILHALSTTKVRLQMFMH